MVNEISIAEIRLCFHNLIITLLKTSVPGIVTLSPTARPEIEMIRFSSNAFGTNGYYSNTPVGAVSHVEEPGLFGISDAANQHEASDNCDFEHADFHDCSLSFDERISNGLKKDRVA